MQNDSQSAYFITCGLTVTLTFDLMISESNQFICVPYYTAPKWKVGGIPTSGHT